MPGSWTAGTPIATWRALAARPGCPRRSGESCGRFSRRCESALAGKSFITQATMFSPAGRAFCYGKNVPFDFAVVDEAQDLSVSQYAVSWPPLGRSSECAVLRRRSGQRIFQQPFSWKSLGVDIRGRSRTLRVNYRTSHQIRMQADRLLGPTVTDVDGNSEDRSDTVSVFNGPPPAIRRLGSEAEEIEAVVEVDRGTAQGGRRAARVRLFVRSAAQLDRAVRGRRRRRRALQGSGRTCETVRTGTSRSAPCTWPRAWSFAPWR